MKFKFGLLPRVVLAIALGVACGFFLPGWATRIALTFNAIFGQFLGFAIPLLILGLVAPGIADLGRNAGRLLALTAALAYAFTLFSGFGTYLTGRLVFPALLEGSAAVLPEEGAALAPYFTVEMPPVMGVMSALVLAFVLGLGMAYIRSETLKGAMDDFKRIIELVILRVIIPLLPFYIFGIFLSMAQSGQVAGVLGVFVKLIAVIFCMTVVLLLVQFSVAGLVARKNPLKMLRTMLTAYVTALGTQSSAATIPVTRRAPRTGFVRRAAVRHDPPLGLDDEDHGLCAGRVDDRRAGHSGVDLRGVHPAAGRNDGGGAGRAGRGHHGGAGAVGIDAGIRRDPRGADDRHLHRHGQFRHGDQRDGRRRRGGDRRCDRPAALKNPFPARLRRSFSLFRTEISINAYPCGIKNGYF